MLDSKLTIKPYLNKKLKDLSDGTSQVYIRVTYKRKSTEIAYRKILFQVNSIWLTENDFNWHYDSIKQKSEVVIIPLMSFLSKYQKDSLGNLSDSLNKISKYMKNTLEDLEEKFIHSRMYEWNDNSEFKINEQYKLYSLKINQCISKLNFLYQRKDVDMRLCEYLNIKGIINFNSSKKVDKELLKVFDDEFSNMFDKMIIEYLIT